MNKKDVTNYIFFNYYFNIWKKRNA
jgi:hypothetical protein